MKKSHSEMIPKLYMKMIPVQVILVVIGGINLMIDNIFAGNLIGPDAMAVTGLFAPIATLMNALNALLFGGTQTLCGKYLGKNMVGRAGNIFSLDMAVMFTVSLLMTLACEISPVPLAAALDASDMFIRDLSLYIRGYAFGLPLYCMGTQFTAFLQFEHQQKLSYAGIIAMFAGNTFFNWLFISKMELGLLGLGLSTSIGSALFFMIQAAYYVSGRSSVKFDTRNIVLSDLADIFENGFPCAVLQLCIFVRSLILNHIIQTKIGADGLAAFSAVHSFSGIYSAVPSGVTMAVGLISSLYIGEGDKAGLKKLMTTFMKNGVAAVTAVSLIFSALCIPLSLLFFRDVTAQVYNMALLGFLLVPLASLPEAISEGFTDYYHCMGHEMIVRIHAVTEGFICMGAFSLLLVPKLGMTGIWTAHLLSAVSSVFIIYLFAWIYKRRMPRSMQDMMCFPEGFGVPKEKRIDISVHSMEEVLNVSKQVWDFCEHHNTSERQRNCASLCVEELAGNIVQHGFDGKKPHTIDIRVTYTGESIVICMKDDCRSFDPMEAAAMFDPEDRSHNVGLRLATRISKHMSYRDTLGLNILTIVI